MPETESNATKSRLEKFIDGCSQLTEIYAVTPLDYTNIMGEWWQRINDIIYTLGLTETQNTPVTIAWTVPVPGRKRSPFYEEEIATKKPDGTTVSEASRVSHVGRAGTGQIKAHKHGLIQSIDLLFQRNIDTWGSLYEYFYNQIHGGKQPVDLTEMIFGKPGLTDAQIQDIFNRACRNLTGDDQGLANSLMHFIEDVIGSNLYDFLDPNKQTPNNASEPNGLIELLFGKNDDGTPLSINDLRDKWKEMEKGGDAHDGLIGRSNEIVDTIGEELYDWLNDEHACGFVYQSSDPNNQVPYLPTFSLKDILFGQSDPNGNSRVPSWCDMIKNLRSGGILKEINNIVNYLGDTYITYVNGKNYDEEDPNNHNPNNPAHPSNPNGGEYNPNQNPLDVLGTIKDGQVLYGNIVKNQLEYEGDWILSPGNICESDYEYQQIIKAQNDQEAIFNTFERVSYDSTGGLYNSGTTNSSAVYMLTYPRSISITEASETNVNVSCSISPVAEATENRVPKFTIDRNNGNLPTFPSYDEQFDVDANGVATLKSTHDYSKQMSKTSAAATYGTTSEVLYKDIIYNWIMLPFETKAEMEAYNAFTATASTPLKSRNAPFRFAKTCRCRNSYGSDGDRGYFLANRINSNDPQVKIQIPDDAGGSETLTFTINGNFLTSSPRYKNCYCTKAYSSNNVSYGSYVYWFEGCNIVYYKSNTEVSTDPNDTLTKIVVSVKTQTFNWRSGDTAVALARTADGSLKLTQTGSDIKITMYPRNATGSVDKNARTYTITWKISRCIYMWDFNTYCGTVLPQNNSMYKKYWYYAMPTSDSKALPSFLTNVGITRTLWSYANTLEQSSWNLDKKKNIVDIGTNSITWLGFLSNKKYGGYYFSTMPNSDTNDDDGMGNIIGGYKDYSTGTYSSLCLNHSYNSLSLTSNRYRCSNNSVSQNIVAWSPNGVSNHTLKKDTVLASGTVVANDSVLNGTTYQTTTTLTAALTIADNNSYLRSGSVMAKNSVLKSGSACNGITQSEDATLNKALYLVASPIANINGRRGLWLSDDGKYYQGRAFYDTESGMYGLKAEDTITVSNTPYKLKLRYPDTERRYVDRYMTDGPARRSDADTAKDALNKFGNVGSVTEAKNNGMTGTDTDGSAVNYQYNWCNVSLIVQKLLGAISSGKFIARACSKSGMTLGSEAITSLGGSFLVACPFHVIGGETADEWLNSVSANIKTSIFQNIASIYALYPANGTTEQSMSATVQEAIFKEKIWPLFELSALSISSLTLDDIFKLECNAATYYCIDRTATNTITAAANYTFLGRVGGWGVLNAYKRRQMNYSIIANREVVNNASGSGKTYKLTLNYYDAFRNMSGIINNRLTAGSVILAGSTIAAGTTLYVSTTTNNVTTVTEKTYNAKTVLNADVEIGNGPAGTASVLKYGSILKAGTVIGANSVISDSTLSARTLTADTIITRDAYGYLNSHYKYPGMLVMTMTTGLATVGTEEVEASIIGVSINGGFEQKVICPKSTWKELYGALSSMTSYGYTCCSNPLTHFSSNKFIDMDNADIYVLDTDTHYRLNSNKGYDKIENAGLTDLIFNKYGTGRLISNDVTNKVYFTRGDNNVVQKVVDSVKLGPGLVYGENNVINVDFSNMDKSDIEKMLKQIKVPIWLTGDKRFYVNKDTGSDYLGTDVNNAQYDGHSEERGSKEWPFKTIQACANYVASTFNMYNRTATIVVSPGVYEESLSLGAYSSTTGVIQLEPWDGWWTTTIRWSGGAPLNINSGAKWRLKGFNLESYYGVYFDTVNHYMSGCGVSDAATFDCYANHFKVIGLKGIIVQTLNGKTNVLKAGSIIKAGSYLRKGISFTYKNVTTDSNGNQTVTNVEYTTTEPVITTRDYELVLDWTPMNACIILNGSTIKKDSIISGMDYTQDTVLELTSTNKWHDLRSITVYTNAIMILAAISLTYNGLWLRSECSNIDSPLVMFHTLGNGCMLEEGSVIAKGSIINDVSYAQNTTLEEKLSVTKGSWLMPGSILAKGSIITKNNYINREKLDIQRTLDSNLTLTNTSHTLAVGSRLAQRSYITAGSIINGERYTAAKTLAAGEVITIMNASSQLKKSGVLKEFSHIEIGSVINGTEYTAAKTLIPGETITLSADSELSEGSIISEGSVIKAQSVINGTTYNEDKTLDLGETIAITTISQLNGGSILAPNSIVASGSTWNNDTSFTEKTHRSNLIFAKNGTTTTYRVLPQWKNNGIEMKRGIFGGARCIHLEDGGFFRSGASYDLQEYCDFTLDIDSDPYGTNASAGNIEVFGVFAGELAIKGGATYLYQYTNLNRKNPVDCRRYRVNTGGILRLTHANKGIAGIDANFNAGNGRMFDRYNEDNDTSAIINASGFVPGADGANTYSKKLNSPKLSFVDVVNMSAVMG